jgi:hypothetical protein|tara:strand:+ start:699 stop:1142 length:444 start_codon:yes stop_codon:yes gene_type:complete
MSDNTTEIEAFLAEVAENTPTVATTAYPSRDRLKAEFDILYNGYIVESFKDGIEGEYGESTVVNMIDTTNDGRRTALWLSNFEQKHFAQFLEASATNGDILPLQVSFLRHKVDGKNGRQYNKLSMRLDASGDDVLIPAVPADQLNEE